MFEEVLKKTKNLFKKIIGDNWKEFKEKHSSYNIPQYNDVVEKMMNCGSENGGYTEYRCCECGKGSKRIAFTCKSMFCLTCAKVYVDDVVSQISKALHIGMRYRHVVLTVPEQLREHFYKNRNDGTLLTKLMQVGYACMEDVVSTAVRMPVTIGCVIVIQTHGRSGHYNPHIHILMTSGGIHKVKKIWRELGYVDFNMLHKKWQYYLLKMMRECKPTQEMKKTIDMLYKKYPKGFVANVSKGEAPKKARGLAKYLAKYMAAPPISVKRIMDYDGENVTYWYNDHETKQVKVETINVITFVGRMVQHIFPKGFKRIRYYGLQATKTFNKWKKVIKEGLKKQGQKSQDAYEIVKRRTYRERYHESIGKDPLICEYCGEEMQLWEIWHPKYGVIFSEEKRIRSGIYQCI